MSFLTKTMDCLGWWLRLVNRREVRAQITCDKCGGSELIHALVFDESELDDAIRKKGWWISASGSYHHCNECKKDK